MGPFVCRTRSAVVSAPTPASSAVLMNVVRGVVQQISKFAHESAWGGAL
jgi:hypothetical protein